MWGFFADKVTSSSKASYNKFVRDIRLATEQYKSLGQSKELDAFLKDKVMEKTKSQLAQLLVQAQHKTNMSELEIKGLILERKAAQEKNYIREVKDIFTTLYNGFR